MLLSRKDTWKPLGIILGEPMSEPMPVFLLPHCWVAMALEKASYCDQSAPGSFCKMGLNTPMEGRVSLLPGSCVPRSQDL